MSPLLKKKAKSDPLVPTSLPDLVWRLRSDIISTQDTCRALDILKLTDEELASRQEGKYESIERALLSLQKQVVHLRTGLAKAVPSTKKQQEDARRAPRLEEICRELQRDNTNLKDRLRSTEKNVRHLKSQLDAMKKKYGESELENSQPTEKLDALNY